jgi:hypothetical protein
LWTKLCYVNNVNYVNNATGFPDIFTQAMNQCKMIKLHKDMVMDKEMGQKNMRA